MVLYKININYLGEVGSGKIKKIKENYLFETDDLLTLDSDLRNYLTDVSGFTVQSVNRIEVDEIICSELDSDQKFFLGNVKLITYDAESGKEGKRSVKVIIQSNDLETASKKLHSAMQKSSSDYEVKSIRDTNILDIILK